MVLPGLDRLLAVCRDTGYPTELQPPGHTPPAAGTLVAGQPFDPMLASVYRRLGGARFGGEPGSLYLSRVTDETNAIAEETAMLREATDFFRPFVLFGGVSGLAWYYATVPALADERGLQPVVFIDDYDDRPVEPIASNVDRFFDVLSRYVEMLVRDKAYQRGEKPELLFPRDVPHLVASDKRLVEMLEEGRFDSLMRHAPGSFQWMEEVLSATRPEPPAPR